VTLALPSHQGAVIAHEQSHLEARDPQLFTFALALLVFMPWNLPLWWQLRRLRFAVEIDCDARVLRRGHDVSRYGETLIAVGERQSATIAMVAAMAESGSLIERRIRNMVRKKTKYGHAAAVALACLGIAFTVGAAEIRPPGNDEPGNAAARESAVDTRTLDGHVGFYQLSNIAVLTISRSGQYLKAQLTGQLAVPIHARSNTEFSYKEARISFVTEPDGRTSSLILHQHGIDMLMKRVDAATAQRVASNRAEQEEKLKGERLNRSGALIILR
jgi:bla regulator protein BlaR1